jgi:hypothetical protein
MIIPNEKIEVVAILTWQDFRVIICIYSMLKKQRKVTYSRPGRCREAYNLIEEYITKNSIVLIMYIWPLERIIKFLQWVLLKTYDDLLKYTIIIFSYDIKILSYRIIIIYNYQTFYLK